MNNVKVYDRGDFPPYLPKLNSLYDDLFSSGKGLRSLLIQKVSSYIGLDTRQVLLLSQTIEFIHNASLLHDDLIDRSTLRRNKTTAWLKYSPEYAVLAGDYLLARVMVNLSRNGNLALIQLTAEVISDLLEGEWLQDSLVRDWNVQLSQLDQVHSLKTASLFKWCLKAPFVCNNCENTELLSILEEAGTLLGVLFQRSDDLLDFDIRNYEKKAVLGDLKSGYLNSFGAYLLEKVESSKRAQIQSIQDMQDLYKILGQDHFNERLSAFDQMNRDTIAEYNHQLDCLRQHFRPDEVPLIQELRRLGHYLYWRKEESAHGNC